MPLTKYQEEEIRRRMRYCQKTGRIVWVTLNKHHPDLLNSEAGHIRKCGRCYIHIFGRGFARSRLAFFLMMDWWPEAVDHINRKPWDDRWINLRAATHQQNVWNVSLRRRNKSGLPMGVRNTANGKYQARIASHRKTHALGTFNSISAAKKAYIAAKRRLHGEFGSR